MRAALLPAGPDPYLLRYWLKNYATWSDAVDHLHITVCGQTDPAVQTYILDLALDAGNVLVDFLDERTDHGLVIDGLVRGCTADLVVLCEDDAFVQRPQVMAECFARIESGETDLVGTSRGYMSYPMMARAEDLWHIDQAAFYPAFLFARRADLDRVTKEGFGPSRFSSTIWDAGVPITSLEMTYTDEMVGDTFVSASLQLRAMGLRCETRSAYRSDQAQPDGPWFHVGALSDGYGWAFMGPDELHEMNVAFARKDPADWYKRVAWWRHVWSAAEDSEHHRRYGVALEDFVEEAGLRGERLDHQTGLIDRLLTWVAA